MTSSARGKRQTYHFLARLVCPCCTSFNCHESAAFRKALQEGFEGTEGALLAGDLLGEELLGEELLVEELLGEGEVLAGVELVESLFVDELEGELASLEAVPPLEPCFDGFEYRSAYHPPPFNIKLPAEICRRAVFFWQAGQVSRGSSTIRCSASHS